MQRPMWHSTCSKQRTAGRCRLPGTADVSGLQHFPFESKAELIGSSAGRGKGPALPWGSRIFYSWCASIGGRTGGGG